MTRLGAPAENRVYLVMIKIVITFFVLGASLLLANTRTSDFGLFHTLNRSDSGPLLAETESVRNFFQQHYGSLPEGFRWKAVRRIQDSTHTHLRYSLQYRDRRVVQRTLDIHYNRQGWIQYASSLWKVPFSMPPPAPGTQKRLFSLQSTVRDGLNRINSRGQRSVRIEPVVWMSEDGSKVRYAFEVKALTRKPITLAHYVVDEMNKQLLHKYGVYRNINNEVYKIHPDRSALEMVTLPGLPVTATTLEDSTGQFHVRREQDVITPEVINVDPNVIHSGVAGWDSLAVNPGPNYDTTCDTNGADPACPNHDFDAVNAYYHIKQYRVRLDGYLTTLGVSPTLGLDPIDVTVNGLAIDLSSPPNGDGADESNNAFYLPANLLLDTNGNPRAGLFFLRPAAVNDALCGGAAVFFDVAREALIIVHEYQHYITDQIAGLVFGGSSTIVGDHLHEGYSDYFGASQVTQDSGATVTEIGEYAFQNCPNIKRDISQIKVFTDQGSSTETEDFADPHIGGWSWASGLWSLRETLGAATVDLIALKSLFFLSTNPGFIEAIESLVKADEALNAGANVDLIRTVFYDTVKFTAGANGVSPVEVQSLDVGFKSCLSVHLGAAQPGAATLIFLLWLLVTFRTGKRWRKH